MTTQPTELPAAATVRVDARRIALISDTHFTATDGSDVPESLLVALRGADLVLHLGHISSASALDRLGAVAPILAVQTALDDRLMGDCLAAESAAGRTAGYTRVIEAGGLRIGAVHDLGARPIEVPVVDDGGRAKLAFPNTSTEEILRSQFGMSVDVVAFAATHEPVVLWREGVLFVNPGSPNLPAGTRKGGPGTLAMLKVEGGVATVEIVELLPD